MQSYSINGLDITPCKEGSKKYRKVSYPVRFGIYSVIETRDHIYQFSPAGIIRHLQPKNDEKWAKDEWIKRTEGNDWVYYTPGIYTGLQSYIGEYYLPCFSYRSNSIFSYDPYINENVEKSIKSIDYLQEKIKKIPKGNVPEGLHNFLNKISKNNSAYLKERALALHSIAGGRASVLPPDSRHVDYDVIPLTLADGCLYKCKFCMVKNMQQFGTRGKGDILNQIEMLKNFYGDDLVNYNSVFFGQHDALNAGEELIMFSAEKAYELLRIGDSYMHGANLFMFASADSFLNSRDSLWKSLNKSPFYTYINIGLETAHKDTMKILGKPVSVEQVRESFFKMIELNRSYDKIEVTANFILSEDLPEEHYPSIIELINGSEDKFYSKGGVYMSPLYRIKNNIKLQRKFIEIKNKLRVPAHIYLIQRL